MGGKISGIGSNMIKITGVKELKGTTHEILPDMIEIGSFIGLAAMTGSEITIKNASIKNLGIIPDTFRPVVIPDTCRFVTPIPCAVISLDAISTTLNSPSILVAVRTPIGPT